MWSVRSAPTETDREIAGLAWLTLFAGVIAWDVAAPETMSAAFRRACVTPEGRTLVTVGWALLTAHLFSLLPERCDPFILFVKAARSLRSRLQRSCRILPPPHGRITQPCLLEDSSSFVSAQPTC